MLEDTLVIIPARGGSKGVPEKNIRVLGDKPLIQYTINIGRDLFPDENICVTTDSEQIRGVAEQIGVPVPFLRPAYLATDTAAMYDVLLHALKFYEKKGKEFERLLLLQPTSPFRKKWHVEDIFKIYDNNIDMVVSVGLSHHNPYFSLFEENKDGYLKKSKEGNYQRRQDCPPVYYYNGSLYLINVRSLKQRSLEKFERVKKYMMEEKYCLDIDTQLDWLICETLLEKGLYKDANS